MGGGGVGALTTLKIDFAINKIRHPSESWDDGFC